MPSLQVRELPENIYQALVKQAKREHRSLAQEAVIVLAKGLNLSVSNKSRREELLKAIEANPVNVKLNAIDPGELVREDRHKFLQVVYPPPEGRED